MALTAGRQRQDLDNGSLEIMQSLEDDPLLDAPLISSHTLHSQLRPKFHAIPAVLLANFLLLIHVAFVVLAFLAAMFCSYPNPNQDKCPGNYTHPLKVQTVIMIAKVVLWILHVFFERYVQHHHSRVRRGGYFSIYRSTRHLKRLPLLIHATGTTALLLILSVQHSFPDHSKVYLYLILGVLSLEMISSLTCLVIYTVKISNFNRAKPRPDIIEEEKMYAYPTHITSEVGFSTKNYEMGSVPLQNTVRLRNNFLRTEMLTSVLRGQIPKSAQKKYYVRKDLHVGNNMENSSLEEIVEKQGDVIEYLQRHNALLSKRLLALTSQQIKT